MLLDWNGLFHRAYDLQPDSCNVLVFDDTRTLVLRVSGQEVDWTSVAEVVTAVRALMSENDKR